MSVQKPEQGKVLTCVSGLRVTQLMSVVPVKDDHKEDEDDDEYADDDNVSKVSSLVVLSVM